MHIPVHNYHIVESDNSRELRGSEEVVCVAAERTTSEAQIAKKSEEYSSHTENAITQDKSSEDREGEISNCVKKGQHQQQYNYNNDLSHI